MKKLLLVTAITILRFATVNAQDVDFGVKGGLNFASIIGANTTKNDEVTAFNFGAMAEIKFSEKFSFQPELMYSGQGNSNSLDPNSDLVELNYLNIPLMAKYYATKGLSLEAGPQIGFLLTAKEDGNDIIDSYKNTDFGVNFGIGYKLDNGLNFSARYNWGLSNITVKNDITKNNSVFQLSVGYFF